MAQYFHLNVLKIKTFNIMKTLQILRKNSENKINLNNNFRNITTLSMEKNIMHIQIWIRTNQKKLDKRRHSHVIIVDLTFMNEIVSFHLKVSFIIRGVNLLTRDVETKSDL